jgi:phosphate starvation-inducible PhoH-like protein
MARSKYDHSTRRSRAQGIQQEARAALMNAVAEEEYTAAPRKFHIQPKTPNQNLLLDAIEMFTITVAIGPAGTGKTYCGCMKTAQLFNTGRYERIVLCRANVPTGKSLGAFPGTIQEKMAPWLAPMTSVLKKAFGPHHYDSLVKKNLIEIQPLETIRGQSFENSLILIDESQNLNMEEIKAITTRLGEGSKMILMGDPNQSDIQNGLALIRFAEMCRRHAIEIPVVHFGVEDIVRSDIVGQLVRMFTLVDAHAVERTKVAPVEVRLYNNLEVCQ